MRHLNRIPGPKQAYEIRLLNYSLLIEVGQQRPIDGKTVANLTKAWAIADERCRIKAGTPLPGTLKPERRRRMIEMALKEAPMLRDVIDLPANGMPQGQGQDTMPVNAQETVSKAGE